MNKEREEKEKILNGVQSQISSFDNKASILVSVLGVVFAISLTLLEITLKSLFREKSSSFKIFFYL